MENSRVSIIIPAFNEAEAIDNVVSGLKNKLKDIELIVVDDHSIDKTAELAKSAGATVISHDRNRGYGASLKTGIKHSSREYVLFCDADGQHSPDDVAKLISEIDEYDVVIGERTSSSHHPLARRPGKMILRMFANYLAGRKIPDLNSGLRIFEKSILVQYTHLMPDGFSFSTTSTFAMLKTGRRMKYIPITVAPRIGKSSVKQVRDGLGAIMLMIRLTVLFEPLKVFLTISLALFLLLIGSAANDIRISGGISDTSVALFIASLMIFMFGLVCDQVSALRRELHEKNSD